MGDNYIKHKKIDDVDAVMRFIGASDIAKSIEEDKDATPQELPMKASSLVLEDAEMFPTYSTIMDHGGEISAGHLIVTLDGLDIECAVSSKCSPQDDYDEWIGHALILARLSSGLAKALEEYIIHRSHQRGQNLTKKDLKIND